MAWQAAGAGNERGRARAWAGAPTMRIRNENLRGKGQRDKGRREGERAEGRKSAIRQLCELPKFCMRTSRVRVNENE